MKFYRRFPSDYRTATEELTLAQDAIYTRLLDWQYSTERRIESVKHACKICRIRPNRHQMDVHLVLKWFFCIQDGEYTNPRFEEELKRYRKETCHKKIAAATRWISAKSNHAGAYISRNQIEERTLNITSSQDHTPPSAEQLAEKIEHDKKELRRRGYLK